MDRVWKKGSLIKSLAVISFMPGLYSPAVLAGNDYDTVYANILNTTANGSGIACMSCHTGSDPLGCGAPTTWQMDSYASAAPFASTMHARTAPGAGTFNMPMALNCTYNDAAVISAANRTLLNNWALSGTPKGPASATTFSISNQQKTQVTLRGTVNTNTTNPNVVAGKNGQYYFEWGTGTGPNYTSGPVGITTRNSISTSGTLTHTLTGLSCGTSYHYRIVATNGGGSGASPAGSTANGSRVTFSTSACTPPTIDEGASISPAATNEDTDTTFTLNYTAGEAGTKTWSILNQGSKGTFSFDTAVTSNPVTVRYSPALNQNGSDNAGDIRVTNSTTGETDTIQINMTITAQNDLPVVTNSGGSPDLNYTETDPATAIDTGVTVSDVDTGAAIDRAEVTVTTNYEATEDVLDCGAVATGITCSYVAPTLTLSSATTNSIAEYQSALRGVTYFNSSANPTVNTRTITYRVRDDQGAFSATDTATVAVSSVSTPPTVSNFTATPAFTEDDGAIVIDSAISIDDPDSSILNRAQVRLTTNYQMSEDTLACGTATTGITSCTFTGATGILELSGNTSLANYVTALQKVTYDNSSQDPNTATRTVTLTVRDDSNTSSSTVSTTISINPVNDPPTIDSTAPTTALVLTEQVQVNNVYTVTQTDPDDISFTYSVTPLAGDNSPADDMQISAGGVVSWKPPRTGVFDQPTAMITVTVTDADASTAGTNKLSDTQMFQIATSPLDTDSDGIADYNDNCPTIANAGQEDMDNDTVRILPQTDPSGIPATGDVDPTATDPPNTRTPPESYLKGGDACDEDVDGDGISKAYEDGVGFLSDTDPADAALDEDGDGVSNLQEFLDDTDPAVDSVGPVVTAPADKNVDATGFFTTVALGTASAVDGNDGNITTIVPVLSGPGVTITCANLGTFPSDPGPFRPGPHVITWATCDSAGNLGTDNQSVNVRPLAGVSKGQTAGEGTLVTVDVVLNGEATVYPASVNYVVSGTATNPEDHNAASGTVFITNTDIEGNTPGMVGRLNINIVADAVAEVDETITIVLTAASNAALGSNTIHTITITEANVAPVVDIGVTQGGVDMGTTIYSAVTSLPAVDVVLTANASDPNNDSLSYQWGGSNALTAISSTGTTNPTLEFDPSGLAAGSYPVDVTVSDGGTTTTASLVLNVVAAEPVLGAVDSDGDGVNDDDAAEGVGDDDRDGIPNYLDDSTIGGNAVQNQTGNPSNSYMIETDAGLGLRLGSTAVAAGRAGVLVQHQDIEDHGGTGGGAGTSVDDSYTNTGGYYDFEIYGLNDAIDTANVVLPLQSALLSRVEYRKYNPDTGWFSFVEDDNNEIRSAPGEKGSCPAPGSNAYTPGLTPFHYCVQLTIQDGGPNDADGMRNYIVRDPGGVGIAPEQEVVPPAADERLGALSPLMLLALMLLPVLVAYRLYCPRVTQRLQR